LFGERAPAPSAKAALAALVPYVERELSRGQRLHSITRHVLGLFHGVPGARAFRRHIAENAIKPGAGVEVLIAASSLVPERGIDLTQSAAA